jgi:imidazolonepropionase-like amidohydrolase
MPVARAEPAEPGSTLILAERVFDGVEMHTGWAVVVRDGVIAAVGAAGEVGRNADQLVELPGSTLLPGLIEGHSHLLLHPYDETSWNDQVLKESEALRVARATEHARATLMAGFTTIRDLGSEGAGYADVAIREAIDRGIIVGPRMQAAGRAIVATGSYGPKGFAPHVDVPLGAQTADGHDELLRVVREQIGHGIDFVKVYADYRWGPNGEARPTFSVEELTLIVETAADSGRPTVAHAATAEGMRRATLAGVRSIEHGDGGTPEVFELMADRGVVLCPTLGAVDAISRYRGWNKGVDPEPERIRLKRSALGAAREAGVTICMGGDSGVFSHGDNALELELLVDYGLSPIEALRAATSVNAELLGLEASIGHIREGHLADLVAVRGDPSTDIGRAREVDLVMLGGRVVKRPD